MASVEYCNNSAVNTIKSQFAEMASVLFMENLHETQAIWSEWDNLEFLK